MRRNPISMLLLAALVAVPALAPCIAAAPDKPACHMGGCQSGQPSAKALMPCCCSDSGRTAEPGGDDTRVQTSAPQVSDPTGGAAEAIDEATLPAPAESTQVPEPVPLYILHASLLA